MVRIELGGRGNVTDVDETEFVETAGMENTGPGKLKVEAVVVKDPVVVTGATVAENASGKSEDVDIVGTEDEVVSRRSTF